jgi:hypothetical protein
MLSSPVYVLPAAIDMKLAKVSSECGSEKGWIDGKG